MEHALPAQRSIVPASTRLVIVEGLYLLHRADGWETISQCFDERWYLDTPLQIAMERLARRHMQAWGITRDAAEHRIATSDRRMPRSSKTALSLRIGGWLPNTVLTVDQGEEGLPNDGS